MSFTPDEPEDSSVEAQLQQISTILAGILAGIALMNGLTAQQLIEIAEGL